MRREVALPAADAETLDRTGLQWETATVSGSNWCFVHGFPIPEGYTMREATLAVRLAAYPQGVLDMVYFYPPLARVDGKAIGAVSLLNVDGKSFQQWSRHYGWTAGVDTLGRHIRRAGAWLQRELGK